MDKNKNRTDLLAAGRKKVTIFSLRWQSYSIFVRVWVCVAGICCKNCVIIAIVKYENLGKLECSIAGAKPK